MGDEDAEPVAGAPAEDGEAELPWVDAIAARARTTPSAVEAYLRKQRIRPSPVLPSPRHMAIHAIRFSGEKPGVTEAVPIDFRWEDLGPGLWGRGSPGNLAGKSSILEVALWLLRGDRPSNLQDDVRAFIREASLDFSIDGVLHRVAIRGPEGRVEGSLVRLSADGAAVAMLAEFMDDAGFRIAMADFMLGQFTLEPVYAWHGSESAPDGGRSQEHGWSALSGALAIGTDYKALLGHVTADGLAGRMVAMFIGLPWIPTLTAAATARKSVDAGRESSRRVSEAMAHRQSARIAELDAELAGVRRDLAAMPTAERILAETRRVAEARGRAYRDRADQEQRLAALRSELREAKAAHDEDRVALNDFREARDAGRVFGGLDPECCPRCEIRFGKPRREREVRGEGCMVCGTVSGPSEADAAEAEEDLIAREAATRLAVESVRRAIGEIESALRTASSDAARLEAESASLAAQEGSSQARADLLIREGAILARKEEAARGIEPPSGGAGNDEAAIAKACEEVTRARATKLQAELLSEVSSELVVLARRFGMTALEKADLKGNGQLPVVKNGIRSSFSSLTVGEKLRVKVATAIAILRVGARRGVGRHPGVLLVDSPGAQEMKGDDLTALFDGLAELCTGMPDLQLVVATSQLPALLAHVPPERLKLAGDDGRMW